MRSLTLLVVMLAALCRIAAAHADFATAYRAYERGDYTTAFTEFSEAARRGHAAAQISLGWMYAQGLGIDRDDRRALHWYRQAAAQGHRDAQAILDVRRLGNPPEAQEAAAEPVPKRHGKPPRDPVDSSHYNGTDAAVQALEERQSAAYWYRRFAEAGLREAQFVLGVRYEVGKDTPRDTAQAIYWYRKAAEQGSALAQFNLGLKYAIGEGVPHDQAMAFYWYQRAAAQGHLKSQFLVGIAYVRGEGVSAAPAQALRWWRDAAEGGYAPAQYHLGLMYAQGDGVARDWPQAYLWFSLAASQGHDEARRSRDEARTYIGPTEIARLQQRARRWGSFGHPNPLSANDAVAPAEVSPTPTGLEQRQRASKS